MYKIGTYITNPIGNNEFHYDERIALGSVGEIFVPSLITGTLDNLELGSEIVFEEAENNKLISCTGLKHFVQTEYEGVPVYIVDNHNHALTFWHKYIKEFFVIIGEHLPPSLVHIDQHADTKKNNAECRIQNSEGIELFVNEKTNVGNFISAAVNSGIVNDVIQVRTDYALHNLQPETFNLQPFILDIDIDFRADKEITAKDIEIIRALMKKAKLITIATSPYFIDQKRAIELIKAILQ